MRYIFWVIGVVAGVVAQATLNNYMPLYLSPNLSLMFTVYMTFYYGYYIALPGIIFLSYMNSIFSHGSMWFYMFSYISVFYLLNFFKKFFDRKQFVAVVAISMLATLVYPLFVLFPALLSGKTILFREALGTGMVQIPVNVLAASFMFRCLPSLDFGSREDREHILKMKRPEKT
jgi:hypothetical protein